MKISPFILALFIITSTSALAGTSNVFLGKNICAESNLICFKGSMDFDYSQGKMKLHGRVKRSTSPGRLTIKLVGTSRDRKQFKASVSANIEGKYSELFSSESKSYSRLKGKRDIEWSIHKVSYR